MVTGCNSRMVVSLLLATTVRNVSATTTIGSASVRRRGILLAAFVPAVPGRRAGTGATRGGRAWGPLHHYNSVPSSMRLFSGSTSSNGSSSRRPTNQQSKPTQQQQQQQRRDPATTGRGRYGKLGKKQPPQSQQQQQQQNYDNPSKRRDPTTHSEIITLQPPPLTTKNGPRLTYFTCRHGYESTLMNEVLQRTNHRRAVHRLPLLLEPRHVSTPALGLVQVEDVDHPPLSGRNQRDLLRTRMLDSITHPDYLDPVYALQTLPNCVVVSADSIKGLAQSIHHALLETDDDENDDPRTTIVQEALRQAPRSSLVLHGLVPGMFKGQKKPLMERRVQTIVQELNTLLKKGYPAARPQSSSTTTSSSGLEPPSNDRWLLQVLLLTPNVAAASLVKCAAVHPSTTPPGTTTTAITATPTSTSDAGDRLPYYNNYYYYWPNWQFPAGLAKVDITNEEMPSSAYRKLMEALECMRIRPHAKCTVYDLGACPGGWTWILRHFLDCSVIAIDKSPLDPRLMKDPRIEFIKGDAFTFEPRPRTTTSTTTTSIMKEVWMVSDIIAYPDRILELLSRWCGGKWADCMVVTMKFHGSQPDLDAIDQAVQVAQLHGYHCRAKHFFNNKNEVTLMIQQRVVLKVDEDDSTRTSPPLLLQDGVLGTPMYPSVASSSTERQQ